MLKLFFNLVFFGSRVGGVFSHKNVVSITCEACEGFTKAQTRGYPQVSDFFRQKRGGRRERKARRGREIPKKRSLVFTHSI